VKGQISPVTLLGRHTLWTRDMLAAGTAPFALHLSGTRERGGGELRVMECARRCPDDSKGRPHQDVKASTCIYLHPLLKVVQGLYRQNKAPARTSCLHVMIATVVGYSRGQSFPKNSISVDCMIEGCGALQHGNSVYTYIQIVD